VTDAVDAMSDLNDAIEQADNFFNNDDEEEEEEEDRNIQE